eukprot:INCI2945.2.p1 GENE.INCI2945.2~~INCI2945.2.p1  ORF type:complete len:363 (+),score=80.98 INCI2945.2:214-1302(+)
MERQQRIRIEALENDLRRRQTSYIRRERAYKSKIEELERQLTIARRGGGSDETEGKMVAIRATHEKIIENIEKMQATTAALMKEQEADLLRQFRVRLFDVQEELASAKAKANDENATVWIKKYRSLEKEMEWVKALADKLEQSNKTFEKENQRLHQNFKSQEEDRSMLVKQLVLVKKDNARLRQEIQELKEKAADERSNGVGASPRRSLRAMIKDAPITLDDNSDLRYREVIKRLKKLLDVERQSIKDLRERHAQELSAKSELELFLRQCIDDTRKEIALRRNRGVPGAISENARNIPLNEFDEKDREHVMELLLSQERVIGLLYAKTFPTRTKPPATSLPPVSNQERDFTSKTGKLPGVVP